MCMQFKSNARYTFPLDSHREPDSWDLDLMLVAVVVCGMVLQVMMLFWFENIDKKK